MFRSIVDEQILARFTSQTLTNETQAFILQNQTQTNRLHAFKP